MRAFQAGNCAGVRTQRLAAVIRLSSRLAECIYIYACASGSAVRLLARLPAYLPDEMREREEDWVSVREKTARERPTLGKMSVLWVSQKKAIFTTPLEDEVPLLSLFPLLPTRNKEVVSGDEAAAARLGSCGCSALALSLPFSIYRVRGASIGGAVFLSFHSRQTRARARLGGQIKGGNSIGF